MNNLPKPSALNLKGDAEEQARYIVNYLSQLVTELDRIINRGTSTTSTGNRLVQDIGYNDGNIVVRYSNGNVKYIDIGD